MAFKGSDIFVGGDFTLAGGSSSDYIAKWHGANWGQLSDGFDDVVNSMSVSVSDVYAGGNFTSSAGTVLNRIAK